MSDAPSWVAAKLADGLARSRHIVDHVKEDQATKGGREKREAARLCVLAKAQGLADSYQCDVARSGLYHACHPRNRHKIRRNRHRP